MNGCFLFHSGCCGASALTRSIAKMIWKYIGCSAHSVPSLSKVAMRWSGGTKSALPWVVSAGEFGDRLLHRPSFQEGRGSAGACAWVVPNQQRPAISTIVFRARWKDGRSIGSSNRGTLLPGVRENFATLRLAHPYHQDCVASMVQSRTSISAIGSRRERFAAHDNPKRLAIFSLGASRRPSGRSTIRPGCAGPPVAQGNEHQRAGVKHVI